MRPRGTWPMLYAMFDEGGHLRRDAVRAQIDAAVAAGASGVAVLGLGTEVSRLTLKERRALVDWVAEDCAERLPFAVTVAGASPEAQTDFARAARAAGAAWAILQPPPERCDEMALQRFFGATADALDCPVAVQNAPQFLGYGFSHEGLAALVQAHPNVSVAKAEAGAVEIQALVERLEGRMAVFNGRAGLELTDNLRAGVAGMIPGIETVDWQVRCTELFRQGREAESEAAYARLLPAVAFIMQGIDHFVTYGKLLAARRLGLALAPQARSALRPNSFGVTIVDRLARDLGMLARADRPLMEDRHAT